MQGSVAQFTVLFNYMHIVKGLEERGGGRNRKPITRPATCHAALVL